MHKIVYLEHDSIIADAGFDVLSAEPPIVNIEAFARGEAQNRVA